MSIGPNRLSVDERPSRDPPLSPPLRCTLGIVVPVENRPAAGLLALCLSASGVHPSEHARAAFCPAFLPVFHTQLPRSWKPSGTEFLVRGPGFPQASGPYPLVQVWRPPARRRPRRGRPSSRPSQSPQGWNVGARRPERRPPQPLTCFISHVKKLRHGAPPASPGDALVLALVVVVPSFITRSSRCLHRSVLSTHLGFPCAPDRSEAEHKESGIRGENVAFSYEKQGG